jgi:glycosyltransferase involved in cell wall biosynthesis
MPTARAIARKAWKRFAPVGAQGALNRAIMRRAIEHMGHVASQTDSLIVPGPLVVSGLINESLGLGRGANLTIDALRQEGLSPIAHDARPLLLANRKSSAVYPSPAPGGIWILQCNPPEAAHIMRVLQGSWDGRYRIGYWSWELTRVPDLWVQMSALFHEIWVPSHYVVDALVASGIRTPVRYMPHPVAASPSLSAIAASAPTSEPDVFTVLALGDVRSSPARKNVEGAIEIYRRCFISPSPRHNMIVKILTSPASHPFAEKLRVRNADRPDIEVREEDIDADQMAQLIRGVSVLLSPHRAEGFGLAIAEALYLGVPALATGWSGNLSYMHGLPESLIKADQSPIRDPYGVYGGADMTWAEPDLEDAIIKLRAIAASAHLRRSLVNRGREAVVSLSDHWRLKTIDEHWSRGVLSKHWGSSAEFAEPPKQQA